MEGGGEEEGIPEFSRKELFGRGIESVRDEKNWMRTVAAVDDRREKLNAKSCV